MLSYGIHSARMYQESQQGRHTKNCLQEFPIILALNYYNFMCTCDFFRFFQKEFQKNSRKQENYAIGLDGCYLFNLQHETEHDIVSAYGVCLYQTFLNYTTCEFDSRLVCNTTMFFFSCLWEGKFLTQPTEYWEALKQSEVSALNEIG